MTKETGTTFTSKTTQQGQQAVAPPPMMSEAGRALAEVSAPSSAYEVRTTSTPAVRDHGK